jgi:small subunit ribosomal protein S17
MAEKATKGPAYTPRTEKPRNRRKTRIGYVVSDKMQKTIVVELEDRVKHPLYGKIIKRSKKYHAHDEGNAFKEGEIVRIEETKPISKLKTWTVLGRVDSHAAPETGDEKPAKKAKAKKADAEAPETEAAPEAETVEA